MQASRILIVTHAPLSAQFGAGQVAINLAEALRLQGHEVTLWSPYPLPMPLNRWQLVRQMRVKLDAFLRTRSAFELPFDLIDSPAVLITQQVSQAAVVISRSVQPDLLYMVYSLNDGVGRSIKGVAKILLNCLYSLFLVFLTLRGWRRSNYILCLGSLEFRWMSRWFPAWQAKLITYVNALSQAEQVALAQVCKNRKPDLGEPIRFLWMGRWVAHKGTAKLVDFAVRWSQQRPQDRFTIAGCGSEAEKSFPVELLKSNVVRFLPSFKREQLYALLAEHDTGLFTSKVEGWGLVLNEMLESGMPVFATPTGGVPDLQPFFKERLKPFPPSLEAIAEARTTPVTPEMVDDYYENFSWAKTAQLYRKFLSNPAKG